MWKSFKYARNVTKYSSEIKKYNRCADIVSLNKICAPVVKLYAQVKF